MMFVVDVKSLFCSQNNFLTILSLAALFNIFHLANASDAVKGDVRLFKTNTGHEERCIALHHIPHGIYSPEDKVLEDTYCAIDIYSDQFAICPKLRSTSPATFIYDISTGTLAGKQAVFEQTVCPRGEVIVPETNAAPTDFKITMNAKNASATFSPASLLYYHFSRYFNTHIQVPVSVFRTIDRTVHEQRITSKGLTWSASKSALTMNHAAWFELDKVEKQPLAYPEPDEIFTSDLKQVYGVLMRIEGKRYGEEFNGTRESGWGKGQNYDFQKTPAFTALRSDKPIEQAIANANFSKLQMLYWMQDLTEITLLDYIFSQQDRVGNIDFVEYGYWAEDGKIHQVKTNHDQPSVNPKAVQIKRTILNDNDAAGKKAYANFTKSTGMLEGIRHYNPKTYQRLQYLAKDLKNQGPLFSYLKETFGLNNTQLSQAINNAQQAADILKSSCVTKKLHFDLDPNAYLLEGEFKTASISCDSVEDISQ